MRNVLLITTVVLITAFLLAPVQDARTLSMASAFLFAAFLAGVAYEDPVSETRRFDTNVPGLEEMCKWLKHEYVTHVVMESTESYRIPVCNLRKGTSRSVLATPGR